MKNLIFLFALAVSAVFAGCDKDDDVVNYDYHAHIAQPSGADKQMGQTLFIEVEFESHAGEAVEHINVRIRNAANTLVVYDEPGDPHVEGGPSDFEYSDQIVLSTANGFSPGDWVIEATVWGHDEGQDLVSETVEFHIHP